MHDSRNGELTVSCDGSLHFGPAVMAVMVLHLSSLNWFLSGEHPGPVCLLNSWGHTAQTGSCCPRPSLTTLQMFVGADHTSRRSFFLGPSSPFRASLPVLSQGHQDCPLFCLKLRCPSLWLRPVCCPGSALHQGCHSVFSVNWEATSLLGPNLGQYLYLNDSLYSSSPMEGRDC